MARIWRDQTFEGELGLGVSAHQYFVTAPEHPFTLKRTLLWWGASCVADGRDLSELPTMVPIGLILVDGRSNNNPDPSDSIDSPWSENTYDPVLSWFSDWSYSPSQSATHVNGHTTLNLSAGYDYDLPLAQQRLLYLYAGGFVDSKAMRVWYSPNPTEFNCNLDFWSASVDHVILAPAKYWIHIRQLFEYIS
jgi:hypothetical protein